MRNRVAYRAVVMVVATLALAACGGGGGSESESEREGGGTVRCEGTAISDTGLPADFPQVENVTLTKTSEAGPTQVVDGFFEGDLQDAYDEYKKELEAAGYSILFDEIEEHDSEISYDGGGRTGQVALREDCEESDRIAVHITSRPE